jgi:tRNA pseudouridine55 synthase
MTDGILNLDKPRGPTSHDVVDHVRALTGIRRVGHAGTLDPLATGVLLVCMGRATRVAEYLMAGQKAYRARVRLGIATDTYDAEGQVTAEAPVEVSRAQVEAALARFRGTITQVPPVYSALKYKGTPLHRLARRGVKPERLPLKARQVEIFRLELTAWEPLACTLEVTCSPGTYVRALAHDLGQALGCGAHLAGLARLSSGEFRLEDAVTLEEFAQAIAEGRWLDLLYPIDAALTGFPALYVDADAARRVCSGRAIPTPPSPPLQGGEDKVPLQPLTGEGREAVPPQSPPGEGREAVPPQSPPGEGREAVPPQSPPGEGREAVPPQPLPGEGREAIPPQPPPGEGREAVPPQSPPGEGREAVPPQSSPREGGEGASFSPPPGGGSWGGGARAYGPDGAFLALVAYDAAADVWRPHKVFCAPKRFV